MKQYGLLAAAFGGTLAVLLVAFLVVEQLGATAATPSPEPSATAVAIASATPRPTPRPLPSVSAAPSASVAASATPATKTDPPATATPRPTATPARSVTPGTPIVVVVPGTKYAVGTIPDNGKLTKLASGAIVATMDRTNSEELELTYRLPAGSVPAGGKYGDVDTALCGEVSGDFYENYGPAGSEPDEYEYVQPGPDGCWHYVGGSVADTSVLIRIRGLSRFQVDKVVYTVHTK